MTLTDTRVIQDEKDERVKNGLSVPENSIGLHLRLCVTHKCPNRCIYCGPGGEGGGPGYKTPEEELGAAEFLLLAKVINAICPVRYIKITGGEPCERVDLPLIIKLMVDNLKDTEIELVSRSPKLIDLLPTLHGAGLGRLTVSLDSTCPGKHKLITRQDTLQELLKSIRLAKELGLVLTINCVPLKGINTSKEDIVSLIHFCREMGAALKFIDLMDLSARGSEFLNRYYFPLSLLRVELKKVAEKHDILKPQGALGTPMDVFTTDRVIVKMRDSQKGTHYSKKCGDCLYYPCPDGRMALRITPDGNLKTCLLRTDNVVVGLKTIVDTIYDFQLADFVSKN